MPGSPAARAGSRTRGTDHPHGLAGGSRRRRSRRDRLRGGQGRSDRFAKGLAKEIGGAGVTVNALAPGYIGDTAFHGTFTAPEAQRGIVGKLPIGRAGTVDDVAGTAVYLASGEAGYITGATFDIGGGAWPR